MKFLTDEEFEGIKKESYNKGYRNGRLDSLNAINNLMLTSAERFEVDCLCDTLVDNLKELSHNTWDKDRINKLIDFIKNRQDFLHKNKGGLV